MSPDQLLTINISPRTVESPQFSADSLLVVLARYGIDPGRVVVELTEREKVEDSARLQANLVAYSAPGSVSPPTTLARAMPACGC